MHSGLLGVAFCPSVCPSGCVEPTSLYIVHHFNRTGLRCATPPCNVNQKTTRTNSNFAKGASQKFNVATKRKFVAKGGKGVYGLVHTFCKVSATFSTYSQFPFDWGRGGLRKMITSFLLLATSNFWDGPQQFPVF